MKNMGRVGHGSNSSKGGKIKSDSVNIIQNERKWAAFIFSGIVLQNAFRFTEDMYVLTALYHALIYSSMNHNEIESLQIKISEFYSQDSTFLLN